MSIDEHNKKELIHVLHMAYSGEKAAGYAYNGHWKSLKNQTERDGIAKIEDEEWEHRKIVGGMLEFLGAKPQNWREVMMATIGRSVGVSCYLIGWFMPMYFAGRLESANVREYDHAAGYAAKLGLMDFAKELNRLSTVEAQHELFFRTAVSGHKFLPIFKSIFGWGAEPQIADLEPEHD